MSHCCRLLAPRVEVRQSEVNLLTESEVAAVARLFTRAQKVLRATVSCDDCSCIVLIEERA
jgi:hypothetical protein